MTDAESDVRLADVRQLELGRTAISNRTGFTFNAPQPAAWRLQLIAASASASRTFAVAARGQTLVAFHEFELVRLQEGPHGGYFEMKEARPIPAPTRAGELGYPDL